jgi:hypothetical protein
MCLLRITMPIHRKRSTAPAITGREKGKLEQAWYEMRNLRRRRFADSVWIPLRAVHDVKEGQPGRLGYKSEFFGSGSVLIPTARVGDAEGLSWSDIGISRNHRPYAFKNSYKPVDVYQISDDRDLGVDLVLDQSFDGIEPSTWHLNRDLVFALELLREGDKWVRPIEDYIEIVRLSRDHAGRETLIEIRAEFLRDYLAARNMALRITSYRQRQSVVEDASHISWPNAGLFENTDAGRFEGRVSAIHEGGFPFGAKTGVFHVSRTDIDPDVDVPIFAEPNDANTESQSWEYEHKGRKLYRVEGEFWRDEWIKPGDASPRVRGDKLPATCSFIIDAAGRRRSADELNDEDIGQWLWFRPDVINAVLSRRGASLRWHSRETASVSASRVYPVHFGINGRDLVTVYAHDVAKLPEWQQRVWMAYNVTPDGGVGSELLSAQMATEPASTLAPERYLAEALADVDAAFKRRWGHPLFREHRDIPAIAAGIHRFRSVDRSSLLTLAKDIARLTADSIDTESLHLIVPLEKGERRGSLKSLERTLATIVPPSAARTMMGPLFGIYELRVGDAHLTSSEIDEHFALVGIDVSASPLQQGLQLLMGAMRVLVEIIMAVDNQP